MKRLYSILCQTTITTAMVVLMGGNLSAGAKYLECGKSYWFSSPTHNHYTSSHYDASGCHGHHTNWKYDGGDQLFYFDVEGTADVTITLKGLHGDLDMFLYKKYNEWGHHKFKECLGASYNGGKADEKIEISGASGRYYLVVDAYAWGVHSGYDIEIKCKEKPKPQQALCKDLPVLYCGDHKEMGGGYSNWDKTTSLINKHPECNSGWGWHSPDYSGPENIFKLSGAWGKLQNVTIDVHSLDHKAEYDIFVYKHCEMWMDPWTKEWQTKFSGLINKCNSHGNGHDWYKDWHSSVYLDHLGYHDEVYVVIESKAKGWGWGSAGMGKYEISVSCGDVCDQPMEPIECGQKMYGKTTNRRNKASYYYENSYNTSAANWGPEMAYEFKLDYEADLDIDLHIKSHADLNMYVMNACDPRRCVASSAQYGKRKHEKISRKFYPGTYYVVIDGYHGDKGNYELEITGCGCSYAKKLKCDQPHHSTTKGAKDRIQRMRDDCFGGYEGIWLKGKDKTFSFKAPKDGTYEFTLTGLSKDLDLFLMSDCEDYNSCLGYSTKTRDQDESVIVELRKNEEIYAHVDSRSTYVTSNFTIEVVCDPQTDPDPDPDPDPEPDPDPDPEPSGHCFSYTQEGNVVTLDISAAELTACTTPSISLMAIPLTASGEPIMTGIIMLDVENDKATFNPGVNEEGVDYRICYEEACDDIIKSCCEVFEYDRVVNIACGDSFAGTTKDKRSNFRASDFEECYSSSSSFVGPDDLVPFTKDSDGAVGITMFHTDANLSLFVLDADKNPVNDNCKGSNFNSTRDLVNGSSVGEYWTDADDPLPAGTYYLLLEGFAERIASDYTVDISCGLDCSEADTVTVGTTMSAETNEGVANNESAYHIAESLKVGYTGGEKVYALVVDSAGSVTIGINPITDEISDLDLFILTDACDPLSVIGQSITHEDSEESVTLDLAASTYYIVVDGWRGSSASYDLVISSGDSGARTNTASSRSVERGAITSLEAYPNPFAGDLFLDMKVSNETSAKVDLMSIDGQIIHRQKVELTKGINQVKISDGAINGVSGMLYYRIQTADQILQGKVIRIE